MPRAKYKFMSDFLDLRLVSSLIKSNIIEGERRQPEKMKASYKFINCHRKIDELVDMTRAFWNSCQRNLKENCN